jgi:two-component system cell cycle sensor histidine kinase/response regulator CckA
VLYMSGYTDNVITSGGMLEKGLAFLQKPFSPGFLVQRVREVLSQTPAV